jgi:hypothetical protein
MKKLIILFMLIAATCKGQLGIATAYEPTNPVLDINQFQFEASYLTGTLIKWGGWASTNSEFDYFQIGIRSEALVIKPTDVSRFFFCLDVGVDFDESEPASKFSDDHHRHFLGMGVGYSLRLSDMFTLKLNGIRRSWGDVETISTSVGTAIIF